MILIKTEKCKNWKTGCHGNVKVGDHVMQVSKCSQKIFRKSRQVWGDSFNRHEVIHLQSLRGHQKPSPGLNRVKGQKLHAPLSLSNVCLGRGSPNKICLIRLYFVKSFFSCTDVVCQVKLLLMSG